MKQSPQQATEKALQSLDSMERAKASPFLYTKIRNRMQRVQDVVPPRLAWGLAAALALTAVINIVVLITTSNNNRADNDKAATVAREYQISVPQTY